MSVMSQAFGIALPFAGCPALSMLVMGEADSRDPAQCRLLEAGD
jgi:hypothetical protein